jgi:hypothetical protein
MAATPSAVTNTSIMLSCSGGLAGCRRFLLALAWIGGGTLLGALLPLLGVAMFASFIIIYWLPISGEIGAARPRPVQAGEGALSRTPSSETQPRADHSAPGE